MQLLAQTDTQDALKQIQRGIEKEGLRVTKYGNLALTPHPRSLGSALTNSSLTTDFSESLLEFITPVCDTAKDALQYLQNIHSFTASRLADEHVWCSSMPCMLPDDASIPLALYGSSNIGTMKTAYRRGLGHRYGRAMQTVAGIHYNFSLPDSFWQIEQQSAPIQNRQLPLDQYVSCLLYTSDAADES